MTKKYLSALSLLSCLLVCTALMPVVVNSWEDPLATDPTGDGELMGEDILSVDAQLVMGFIYFRFKMNEPLFQAISYSVFIDFDKNASTGGYITDSDLGYDACFYCEVFQTSPDIQVNVLLDVAHFDAYVGYNMTANNGSAMVWSAPNIIDYFNLAIFTNGSQGDVAFGMNWTYFTTTMALENVTGDSISMYIEF